MLLAVLLGKCPVAAAGLCRECGRLGCGWLWSQRSLHKLGMLVSVLTGVPGPMGTQGHGGDVMKAASWGVSLS